MDGFDGRKGWDMAWREARLAAGTCTRALRREGFGVSDPAKLEEALAELFLPALRLPPPRPSGRDRACGHAGSPHSSFAAGGGGKGQDDSGARPQGLADPQKPR